MDLNTLTIADFKTRFPRGFAYLPATPLVSPDNQYNYVLDADIQDALDHSVETINQELFSSDSGLTRGALLLTAHFLVLSLRTELSGMQSTGQQIEQSKSVGNVSSSFVIPERFSKDPILNSYSKTGYGQQYLEMIMPALMGNVGAIYGGTNA